MMRKRKVKYKMLNLPDNKKIASPTARNDVLHINNVFFVFVLLMVIFVVQVAKAHGDTIFLTNGNVVFGKITSSNAQGVEIQTDYGELNIPHSQIKKIKYETAPQTQPSSQPPAVQPRPQAPLPPAPAVQPQVSTQPTVKSQVQTLAGPTQTTVAQPQPQVPQPVKPSTEAATVTQSAAQATMTTQPSMGTPQPSQTQPEQQRVTVYLKTGEVIKGLLLDKTAEVVSVKSNFGVINLKPDQIQKIEYEPIVHPQSVQKPEPQMVILYTKSGEVVKGELVQKTDKIIQIKNEFGLRNINPNDVQQIGYAMAPVHASQPKPTASQNEIQNPMPNQNIQKQPPAQPHPAMQFHPTEQGMLRPQKTTHTPAHTGIYIGVGLGVDIPQGPDTADPNMFAYAPAWEAKIGWDIVRYFGIEVGYEQGLGAKESNGAWTYLELPYGNIKIHLPFSDHVFSIILGVSNAKWAMVQGDSSTFQKVLAGSTFTTTNKLSANDVAINFGIGYDWYMSSDWSLGGELIYHYFTSVISGTSPDANGNVAPYSSQYSLDLSNIGLYINAAYHFNF